MQEDYLTEDVKMESYEEEFGDREETHLCNVKKTRNVRWMELGLLISKLKV